jgi:tetratricopeptide (TPR) repeat protein
MWHYAASAYYWAPGERDKARVAYQHAARLIEQELKINPRDSKAMLALADCYSILGRSGRARELVERALKQAPGDAENMFRAADVEEQLGDRTAALDWLGKAMRAGYPMTEIERDPTLRQLRTDPRYRALAEAAAPKPVGPRS